NICDMADPQDDRDLKALSDIFGMLRSDAKEIVHDLQKGTVMWREAAGANVAAAGFLLILAQTSYRLLNYTTGEGFAIVIAELALAGLLFGFAGYGFRKYFKLRKRYAGLFEKARRLE